jgi:putative heme iron utilization protein
MATQSPLHADLVEMLEVTRAAERDLYAALAADVRDSPASIGEWSAKDVLAHISAWRAIEARRLEARAGVASTEQVADPELDDPIDESNALLHAQHADWAWEAVDFEADASVEALIAAFGRSSTDILCECPDGIVAGNGANAANHSMAHLSDIASLAGWLERYDAFAQQLEAILARGHLPPRDSGVMLYNIGCHHALSGDLDQARRLMRSAFAHRHDLLESALEDSDLVVLNTELVELAAMR